MTLNVSRSSFQIAEALRGVASLRALGKYDEAVARCRALAAAQPNAVAILESLADLLEAGPTPEQAVDVRRRLAQIESGRHERHSELAGLLYRLRRLPDAERAARQALALNPYNPQAHNLLGMIHSDQRQPEAAEFHYRQVLELHEPVAPICANLANAYVEMGRLDEAESFFRQTLYLDPKNIEGLLSWVRMEEARRRFDRAAQLLDRAETIQPRYAACSLARSALLRRTKAYAEALAQVDEAAARDAAIVMTPRYWYERGEVLDKLERYDEAFGAFSEANRLARFQGNRSYDAAAQTDFVGRMKTFFTRDKIAPILANVVPEDLPEDMPKPIFVVGFPRSGTTLTEQILASHPNISGGDELDYVWRMTQLAPHLSGSPQQSYPECLGNLATPVQRRALDKFRSYYLCNVELRRIVEKGKGRFTDKMPLNETHLGLIHLAFPRAPIVHLIRHPLDVVLSTYFNDLTHGGNCSYDLTNAARHYALIFDLIQHYRSQLDLRYLALRYEDVVDDPEPRVRELLDFLGEPWDERCLAFHENQRYARTASYAQVTEKLYTRSLFRYRNYRRQVEAILPILEPAIEALGYTVE